MATIRIELPDTWVDAWWGWYLDGGGDDGFYSTLQDKGLVSEAQNSQDYYQEWDEKAGLIQHSDKPFKET